MSNNTKATVRFHHLSSTILKHQRYAENMETTLS